MTQTAQTWPQLDEKEREQRMEELRKEYPNATYLAKRKAEREQAMYTLAGILIILFFIFVVSLGWAITLLLAG
jgi:hypothetical protein